MSVRKNALSFCRKTPVKGISLVFVLALVLVGLALWSVGGLAAPLLIRQPAVNVTALPASGSETSPAALYPGETLTLVVQLQNVSGSGAELATSGFLRVTLPVSLVYQISAHPAFLSPVSSTLGNQQVMTWTLSGQLAVGTSAYLTVTYQLAPNGNVLGTPLDVTVFGSLTGASSTQTRTRNLYYAVGSVRANSGLVSLTPETSVNVTGNSLAMQVVAGELVTVTYMVTVPQGTVAYSVTPRLLWQDGLSPTNVATPGYTVFASVNNNPAMDRQRDIGNYGYQVQFTPQAVIDANAGDVVLVYTMTAVTRPDRALQNQPLAHNAVLRVQPILRFCESPGCVINETSSVYYAKKLYDLSFRRPEIVPTLTFAYTNAPGVGEGGDTVVFHVANINDANHPPAYDLVLTATLDSGLTLDSVEPPTPYSGTLGGVTYIRWELDALASAASWPVTFTATLPAQLEVGREYTVATELHQETYAGAVAYEGLYSLSDSLTFMPGLAETGLQKEDATTYVTVGEVIPYTVTFTQGADSVLASPRFSDTLPVGFHYVTSSLQPGAGLNLLGIEVQENATQQEVLVVTFDTLTVTQETAFTFSYQVRLTGKNTDDADVYATTGEIGDNDLTVANVVRLFATVGGDDTPLQMADASVIVRQPFMRITNFTRENTGDLEIGVNNASFRIQFQNVGYAIAYDVVICDVLPQGIEYKSGSSTAQESPMFGATGEICWRYDSVSARSSTFTIDYQVGANSTALPGDVLIHVARFKEYWSLDKDTVPDARNYLLLPAVQSHSNTSRRCADVANEHPYKVLGLAVTKKVQPSSARPGDTLTYTIVYTDISSSFGYTGFVLTDTFGSHLTFVSADPAPDAPSNPLVWSSLPAPSASAQQVTVQVLVESPLTGVSNVTNQINWYSVASAPTGQQIELQRVITTPLLYAEPEVSFTNPVTPHAGGILTYTVVYTNNGISAENLVLTLNYDDHLIYGNKSGTATASPDGTVFTDTVPAGQSRTLLIYMAVEAPLLYDLTTLTSEVGISSQGAFGDSDSLTLNLARPIIVLDKHVTSNPPTAFNDPVWFTFTLRNTGSWTATHCILTDRWDSNLDLVDANQWVPDNPTLASATYATYTQGLATLPAGMTSDQPVDALDFVVGTAAGVYTNALSVVCDQVYGQAIEREVWAPSIQTTKQASDIIAFPGRMMTYTLWYTNTMSNVAQENVVITDTLPLGFEYRGCTVPEPTSGPFVWTCGESSPGIARWTIGTLASTYPTGTFTVWGWITDELSFEGTSLTNTTASKTNIYPVRPGDEPVVTVVSRPRLALTQTLISPYTYVAPGDWITYEVTYHNWGTAAAENVAFTVDLPTAVVSYVTATGGGAYADEGISWPTLNNVPAGSMGTVRFVVEVLDEPGAVVQFVEADLEIHSKRLNQSQSDDQIVYGLPVDVAIDYPDLDITKAVQQPVSFSIGNLVTYTLTYTNVGGGSLHSVVITDEMSTYFTTIAVPAGCQDLNGNDPGGVISCTVGVVEQGAASASFVFVATLGNVSAAPPIANSGWASWVYSTATYMKQSNIVYIGGDAPYDLLLEPAAASGVPPYPAPKEVYFNIAAEGTEPIGYIVTFGNGDSASGTFVGFDQVNTTYAVSGTYTVIMTATNAFGHAVITYPVTVTGGPDLQVSSLTPVELLSGGHATRTLTIANGAAATDILNWSLSESPERAWLTPSLTAGTLDPGDSDAVTLDFDATGLTPGSVHTTTLLVAGDGAPVEVDVTLTVLAPTLAWSPSSFTKTANEGDTTALTDILTIQNTGAADLHWSLSSTAAWLTVSVSGQQTTAPSGQANVTVSFNPTGLVSNTYTANLQITSDDPLRPTASVPVTFTIRPLPTDSYNIYLPLVLRAMP